MSNRKRLDKSFAVSGYYVGMDLIQVNITHHTGTVSMSGEEFHRLCGVVKGEEIYSDSANTWQDCNESVKTFCSRVEK